MKHDGRGKSEGTAKVLKTKGFQTKSKEEMSEIAKKGQKAGNDAYNHNQAVKKEQKTMSEILKMMVDCEITNEQAKQKIIDKCPILDGEKITEGAIMNATLIQRAKGDDQVANTAYTIIRDTIGEKPTEKQEINNTGGAPVVIEFAPLPKPLELDIKK